MPNYLEYQKSVAAEFKALEKRVRNLIDNKHWGEEGRFKEVILVNYLKRILPKHLSVGTGFVRNQDDITTQIDIIIYNNTFPLLFSEGDFVIATSENVVAIIEVKSNIEPSDICNIIDKANNNAKIIAGNSEKFLFNGVFSYNCSPQPKKYIDKMQTYDFSDLVKKQHFNQIISRRLYSCVNHIALGDSFFLKLWSLGQDEEGKEKYISENPMNSKPYYSIYDMEEGLAYSYFLSNLQEFLVKMATGLLQSELPEEMKVFLYPLKEGKEINLIERIYLEKGSVSSVKGQKFLKLVKFFDNSKEDHLELTFEQIEAIIGQKLSDSAYKYYAYWHPSETHTITLSWINAGYEMDKLNLKDKQISFKKIKKE